MRHVLFLLLLLVSGCPAEEDTAVPVDSKPKEPKQDAAVSVDSGTPDDGSVAQDSAVAGSDGGSVAGSAGKAVGGAGGIGGAGAGGVGGNSSAGTGGSSGQAGSGGSAGQAGDAAVPCVAGQTSCDDVHMTKCSASGVWEITTTCPFVCDDGQCKGSCVPGAKHCSGLLAQTCNSDGQWVTDQTCPYVCSGGSCAGQCVPGATKCAGLTVQTCNASGVWTNAPAACQFACSAGACSGTCQPSSMQCSGLQAQTCDAGGNWQTTETCPHLCNGGSCGGSCTPGARRCNGTVAQQCNGSGQWVTDQVCPYVCSGAGSCGGQCVPDSMQCSGLSAQTCSAAGAWQTTATCPYACSAGSCTGVCTPGAKRCSGMGVQTCSSEGQWQTAVACPSKAGATAACSLGQCQYACDTNFADCNANMADGCEVNLQSDSNSCGACGRECCGDGVCSAGKCQPAVVVPGGFKRIAMDATNYYTVANGDSATIQKTSRASGVTTDLVPTATSKGVVWKILVINNDLYWIAKSSDAGGNYFDIYSIPVAGGGPITPITSFDRAYEMTYDGSKLLWSLNAPNDGVSWRTLATGATGHLIPGGYSYSMVSDGQYLYYVERTDIPYTTPPGTFCQGSHISALKRTPIHGTGTEVVDQGCGEIEDLFINGTNLYYNVWYSRPTVTTGMFTIPLLPEGLVVPMQSGAYTARPVVDGTTLYYCGTYGSDYFLYKRPLSGGTAVLVSPAPDCSEVVKQDGQCIYYSGATGISAVNKAP